MAVAGRERRGTRRGWASAFSAGTFGAGTYWLYISIHVLGQAPIWLALCLMLALVAIMGALPRRARLRLARWLPATGAGRWLLGLPAAWLLVEWWRGWFLSGFSWLSLGYSQTDTWLAGFAPVAGVYGISALLLLCAGAPCCSCCGRPGASALAALASWCCPGPRRWPLLARRLDAAGRARRCRSR